MKHRKSSIDGFVTRRPQRSLLNERSWQKTDTTVGHMRTDERQNVEVHTGKVDPTELIATGQGSSLKDEIGQSLSVIDTEAKDKKAKKKKRGKKSKIAKLVSLIIGLVLLAGLGYLVFRAWEAGSKVFQGNLLGVFQQQELKKDASGRSNVLILGTTEDTQLHGGGDLTDSMMVLSVDQQKKDAYMYSIPRDLYVEYGRACVEGYQGKINSYFSCITEDDTKESQQKAMDGMRQFIGDIFGMEIQYVAHVNTQVIKDSVDAVGGITVNVQSDDPRGVLDTSVDWMCYAQELTLKQRQERCPTGHYIDFKNGPNAMDGDKALWFSRARGADPGSATYGLGGGNFDREKNQQLVLMALKDKATSSGTLTDVTKVMGLLQAMGDNLRSNIESTEIQTIMKLAAEIDMGSIHQLSFVEEDNMLVTTGMMGSQSIVRPVAGLYDYSEIRAYIKKTIYATPLTKEGARLVVLNGSGVSGLAQAGADKLEDLSLSVEFVGNAPAGDYPSYVIYQLSEADSKPLTAAKLSDLYGVDVTVGQPPFSIPVEADFVVVIGTAGE